MQVEALVAQPAVKGFDESIFDRAPWTDKIQPYLVSVGPGINRSRAKLRPVVHRDRIGVAPPFGHSFQTLDHPRSRHVMGHFQFEALARKLIDRRQGAEVAPAF